MKRLLIVADHSLIVEAIRLALRHTADFRIVGHVDGRVTVSQVVEKAQPDIVLVDDMQRREDALARIGEVQEDSPNAMVILLTGSMEREWLAKALEAGADGIICKAVHPVSLATLLRETVHGNVFHSFAGSDGPDAAALRDCPLTSRELEILGLVAEGGSNRLIAQKLWVTEQTVKFHLSNIYRKLGVANRTEASHYAHVHNLLPVAPAGGGVGTAVGQDRGSGGSGGADGSVSSIGGGGNGDGGGGCFNATARPARVVVRRARLGG